MSLKRSRSDKQAPDLGVLGEDFVAQCLQAQGWIVLHRRWRCRWGELDIIAQQGIEGDKEDKSVLSHAGCPMPYIVFIEVKTRSQGNWDGDGILSITLQKQAKLWQAAQFFLAAYPELADYPCRFDVALVSAQRISRNFAQGVGTDLSDRSCFSPSFVTSPNEGTIEPCPMLQGSSTQIEGYRLTLQDYIQSAFVG